MRRLSRWLGLLPGPATLFLETFHSFHLLLRFTAQRVDLSIDFRLRAGWAAAGAQVCPDGSSSFKAPSLEAITFATFQ